jgi:2,3-bisphosphoglycerate-independent phosphoglycerate mutase
MSTTPELPVPRAVLVVLDGWGLAPPGPGNAVDLADTPVFDDLWARYPHTTLTASGKAVGLPDGQMGNSEVGHLNLGAGAVIQQDLTRIDAAVEDGTLGDNPALNAALDGFERVHLIGLVSDGGVHSGWKHLEALIALAGAKGVKDVVIHAFTDGRDTSPRGGEKYLAQVEEWAARLTPPAHARIGSVIGRYYAMDRDKREERTKAALDLLRDGLSEHHAHSAVQAVRDSYERDERGDEFVAATTIGDDARVRPQDSVIAFNFRPDRMRQLTEALAPAVARYTTLTEYEEGWPWPVAFPPQRPAVTMTKVIAQAGGKQLHVAETEKYPHVTYFFGGGEEEPEAGERRELAPSPRDVPTYDKKPEMSAREAADKFVAAWREDEPQFGIINFANADMVGHTGVIPAAVKAVETVDACLGDVVAAVQATGGALLITADHGNADEMLEEDGSPDTAHSLNPVPVIVTVEGAVLAEEGGILADVAPTLLQLLGIDQPAAMTGRSLLSDI